MTRSSSYKGVRMCWHEATKAGTGKRGRVFAVFVMIAASAAGCSGKSTTESQVAGGDTLSKRSIATAIGQALSPVCYGFIHPEAIQFPVRMDGSEVQQKAILQG